MSLNAFNQTRTVFLIFAASSTIASASAEILPDSVVNLRGVTIIEDARSSIIPLSIPVTTIDVDDLACETQPMLLSGLNGIVPGFFITERGVGGYGISEGGSGAISMRGFGGSRVLLLMDGQPQYAGIFGHAFPDFYRQGHIGKIEVIRGPASVLYGSNAMAGVIKMVSNEPQHMGWQQRADFSYGSYDQIGYHLRSDYRSEDLQVGAFFSSDQADGSRVNANFHYLQGGVSSKYQINQHWDVAVNYSLAQMHASDPGLITDPYDNRNDPHDQWVKRGSGMIALQNRYKMTEGHIQLFGNHGKNSLYDGFLSKEDREGVLLHQQIKSHFGADFTVGLDMQRYGAKARNVKMVDAKPILSYTDVYEFAPYFLYDQSLWNGQWGYYGGVRYQASNSYANEWIPEAGVRWHPAEEQLVSFRAAKGFRNPTLRDLYISWGPRNQANKDLEAERLWHYELNYRGKFKQIDSWVEVSLFYSDAYNLIQLQNNQLQNTGAVQTKGIEVAWGTRIRKSLAVEANYSYLDRPEKIVGAPKHQAFAQVNWDFLSNAYAILRYHQVWDVGVVNAPTPQFETYGLMDLTLGYRPTSYLNLSFCLENILDQTYTLQYGYPMPGILASAKMQVTF